MAKTLLFQGDSITDCGRATCGGAGFPTDYNLGPGYPGLIGTKLQGEQPEKGWNVLNRGIGGSRIVDLYARWKIDGINLKPDIISILIGVNDGFHEKWFGNGVEVPRFDKFYRMILDWTLKELPDTKFVLMEPFLYPLDDGAATMVEDIRERQEVVRRIAKDYGTVFIPLHEVFDEAIKRAPTEYWFADSIHLKAAGHQLVANAWLKAAEKNGLL